MEVSYSNGYLADLDPRYYRVERPRVGVTGAFDIKQSNQPAAPRDQLRERARRGGVPDRPPQEEHYHWWANFGVKINF